MAQNLLGWAAEQPDWVKDSLRRIAIAADYSVGQVDADSILDNVRAAARSNSSIHPMISIDASHLGGEFGEARRTVLVQLGPVQNIDRLAGGQKLRMAAVGITLVYGKNGSGKSGYLPREIAILEHHGELCQRMAAKFSEKEKDLTSRLRVPLPAGYTAGSNVSLTFAKLDPKASSLPTEDEVRRLSELSNTELEELARLEAELATDPVALAATRHRAVAVLKRVCEVLGGLRNGLSETVGATIASARRELVEAAEAERIAASASFLDEPVANVGGPAWRILFEAARKFAATGTESAPERLPQATGELCLLCLEPLTSSGAARLTRFNDFVSGEAAKRADWTCHVFVPLRVLV